MLGDVFENFRDMCLEIYELDPANFLSAPGIAWKAASQKIKLDLISTCYQHVNWYQHVIYARRLYKEEYVTLFINMQKANNKCMKDYDKNKELPYLQYWDVNNLYGWARSQKLLVKYFEWINDTTQFNEDFKQKLPWRKW